MEHFAELSIAGLAVLLAVAALEAAAELTFLRASAVLALL